MILCEDAWPSNDILTNDKKPIYDYQCYEKNNYQYYLYSSYRYKFCVIYVRWSIDQ